mmetsp:Transcript_20157/g.36987  ORF Transcript_20157/g.36987 Transcript_20157/m.36987 type:complete len:81 (-) Transcript_20157:54-296(-)
MMVLRVVVVVWRVARLPPPPPMRDRLPSWLSVSVYDMCVSLPQVFDPASTAYAIAECFIAAIFGQLLDRVYSTANWGPRV